MDPGELIEHAGRTMESGPPKRAADLVPLLSAPGTAWPEREINNVPLFVAVGRSRRFAVTWIGNDPDGGVVLTAEEDALPADPPEDWTGPRELAEKLRLAVAQRDRDWILAIAELLGTSSGRSAPLTPEAVGETLGPYIVQQHQPAPGPLEDPVLTVDQLRRLISGKPPLASVRVQLGNDRRDLVCLGATSDDVVLYGRHKDPAPPQAPAGPVPPFGTGTLLQQLAEDVGLIAGILHKRMENDARRAAHESGATPGTIGMEGQDTMGAIARRWRR